MVYNADLLRAQRAFLKLSNEQIAEKAECSESAVSNIMNGRGDNPGIQTLSKVAQAVGLTLSQVVIDAQVEAV